MYKFRTFFILLSFLFSFDSSFARGPHKLKLNGLVKDSSPKTLTLEMLKKDFPVLTKVKNVVAAKPGSIHEGIQVKDLVKKYASSEANTITLKATNNYKQTLPLDKIYEFDGVIAFLENGVLLPRKAKGTYRLVFDMNQIPEEKHRWYDSAGVWSIVDITFEKK